VKPPDRPLSVTEWRNLKEARGNSQRFEIQMMCAMFTSATQLDIAKSLLTFAAVEGGTLSYELLLRYLTLCVSGGHDAEASELYGIMRGSFPSLDTGASSLFIKSFSRTQRWKEALDLLNQLKTALTPSARNYGDVIAGAAEDGDAATAWALYQELIGRGLSPHQETWEALFRTRRPGDQEKLLQVLLYMRDNQIYPQRQLAATIKAWFERGVCGCCESELESIQLTAAEYRQLKDRVMADVIQGRDVFTKTTPEGISSVWVPTGLDRSYLARSESDRGRGGEAEEHQAELERFRTFVGSQPAFDVVVDGLNVANLSKDRSRQSETLLAVVSELQRRGLSVLVLGRKHMLRPSRSWPGRHMDLLQLKARCFFTENISEDDPFLLYAALHSGNHCRFVSRDLMRDHKARLADGATRQLFFKWQRGHQMVVDGAVPAAGGVRFQVRNSEEGGGQSASASMIRALVFQSVPGYDTVVQRSQDSWHIPYDHTQDRSTYEVPQRWLCL
ncbi:unnamed protein product, partial [Tetraodon nigroviridis]